MRVVVTSTKEIVTVNGVKARVWSGVTANGLPVMLMVSAIGIAWPHGEEDKEGVDVPHEKVVIKSDDGREIEFGG